MDERGDEEEEVGGLLPFEEGEEKALGAGAADGLANLSMLLSRLSDRMDSDFFSFIFFMGAAATEFEAREERRAKPGAAPLDRHRLKVDV